MDANSKEVLEKLRAKGENMTLEQRHAQEISFVVGSMSMDRIVSRTEVEELLGQGQQGLGRTPTE